MPAMTDIQNHACWCSRTATTHQGSHFGFDGESCGELVFNTAMSGYQEILTDPSATSGQIVLMTYPLIGNTGINAEDVESRTAAS